MGRMWDMSSSVKQHSSACAMLLTSKREENREAEKIAEVSIDIVPEGSLEPVPEGGEGF